MMGNRRDTFKTKCTNLETYKMPKLLVSVKVWEGLNDVWKVWKSLKAKANQTSNTAAQEAFRNLF